MPDPAKVKVAIVGCVLVIGASIGIGLGVSKKNDANGAIVSNESGAISGNTGVTYKDPSPTKAKDILDELEHGTARYGTYTGNYIDYNSNPLEENGRSGGDDDNEEIADWEDNGLWTDDGWDDDGWNDDGHSVSVGSSKSSNSLGGSSKSSKHSSGGYPIYHGSSKSSKDSSGGSSKSNKGSSYSVGGSSKSNKGSSYSIGNSSKSNKGSSYSVDISSKSNKGSSSIPVMHFGGSSKSHGYGINVSAGKSNKATSTIHYVANGKPVKDTWGSSWSSSWGNAWGGDEDETPAPTPKPTPQYIRGKWENDGHTPEPTPNPTPQPSNEPISSQPTKKPTTSSPVSPMPSKNPSVGPSSSPSTSPTSAPSSAPSTSPSASPSRAPTTTVNIVTPAPTMCEERLWHPNPFFKFCINDSNYPANWATPDLYEQYFYESLAECCRAIFGTDQCESVDICNSPTPTVSPVTTAPTSCEERKFYALNTGDDKLVCSNGDDIPPGWAGADYFYDNLKACCLSVFGNFASCDFIDVCTTPMPSGSPVTPNPSSKPTRNPTKKPTEAPIEPIITPVPSPAPTSCEERKWCTTINMNGQLVCSNDYHLHGESSGTNEYHYSSLEECCAAEFESIQCSYVDVCNTLEPTPNPTKKPTYVPVEPIVTPEPTPAPTPCDAQVFFFDGNICSNEFYIADAPAYTSIMICCNVNFGAGSFMNGSCEYVDMCNTLPPTPSPVTPEPTPSPVTPAPTPCEAQVFYFDGNVCTNEFYVGDSPAYNSAMACCNTVFGAGSYMNGQCNYVDVCNTLPPSPSPVTPEPTPSPIENIVTLSPVTPAPTPCEALLFFFDGETCSNEFIIADASSYETAQSCCNANFGTGSFLTGSCGYVDICNTLPPSPAPTIISTFGSTPTVSKETTGPPTMAAEREKMIKTRDMPHGEKKTVTSTECEPIYAGNPRVCVNVCTDIISVYSGEELISEDAKSYETACPVQ